MKKTFAVQICTTTGRSINGLPEDWTDVCYIPLDGKHPWGNIERNSDGTYSTTINKRFNADVEEFEDKVLNPLAAMLEKHGFDVDFGKVTFSVSARTLDIACIRTDFLADTNNHTYKVVGNEQFEILKRSQPMRVRYATIDGVDCHIETNSYGYPKQQKHFMLDLFNINHDAIEKAINIAVAKRRGGHVRVRIAYVGSVSVTGKC